MKLKVSSYSQIPIYEQIKQQIKGRIMANELAPLTQLPSIRQMALTLQVGIVTVKRAYEDLEKEGYIVNKQGKGCYVKELDLKQIKEEMKQHTQHQMQGIIKNCKQYGITQEEVIQMIKKGWK